jgi:(E)-4-hydroxy-3-methylbut-2-enyl-diphosphate synthase
VFKSREISIGNARLGGDNPVLIQSMCDTDTMNTGASVDQCVRIAKAGAGMVRLTTRNKREAGNIKSIKEELLKKGYNIPVVADVHFSPETALEAAIHADKIRINPGNFANGDIAPPLLKLIEACRIHGTAIRIGVNHGSLSEKIMQDYGDTPEGMVESALQYLRICRKKKFDNIVVSLKSSNTRIMIQSNRMMARKMSEEGMDYPFHLGVTEAGAGENARIKSSAGIVSLLSEGIGDTIRVSLTEAPENEIHAARKILETAGELKEFSGENYPGGSESYLRRETIQVDDIGGGQPPIVIGSLHDLDNRDGQVPDYFIIHDIELLQDPPDKGKMIINSEQWLRDDFPEDRYFPLFTVDSFVSTQKAHPRLNFVMIPDGNSREFIKELPIAEFPVCLVYLYNPIPDNESELQLPVIIRAAYNFTDEEILAIRIGGELGHFFIDGYADGIWIDNPFIKREKLTSLAFNLLQACRARMTETEFIACPSCGRTLFNIHERLVEVQEATSHLKKLKIAVMGCIVNGPGEMADADYGYVGAGPGKISLYKGRDCIRKNIPEKEALEAMIQMIKDFGDWEEPGSHAN